MPAAHSVSRDHGMPIRILRVAVPSPLRRVFDYLPPADILEAELEPLQPGCRVVVPFGRQRLVGLILSIGTESTWPLDRLRPVIKVLDTVPVLPTALMKAVAWAIQYYQSPPGEVTIAVLPAHLRDPSASDRRQPHRWRVHPDFPGEWAEILRRSPRQWALLLWIQSRGQVSGSDCTAAGFTPALLQALVRRGALIQSLDSCPDPAETPQPMPTASLQPALTLNPEQAVAVNAILATVGKFHCFLLEGVTGSGKTEVYLQVIAQVIASGRQALVLVPEIGLTPQTFERFAARFGATVVCLHSDLSDGDRRAAWSKASTGEARVVIGTRSAVFVPLQSPGVIIIDEEHDLSFKQQEGFRYSARDFAIVRASQENIPVILGSATPALESLRNLTIGRYTHLPLRHRAGGAQTPSIRLIDTSTPNHRDELSTTVLDSIHAQIRLGNQVLVFINRRGFAPALYCEDCGWVAECENCDAQLTVHRTPPHLCCHHCEARRAIPTECPQCAGHRVAVRGVGTQRLSQRLQRELPEVPVIRIDRDAVRRRGAMATLLTQVHTGSPCILVGTQMLAKGHHFPKVTLVVVLDADAGLFSPDFRAQEHLVQLLFQVAGRTGRGLEPGEVLIQTRHADHPLLQTLVTGDYQTVADQLLAERRATGMPPYSHLAAVRADAVQPEAAAALLTVAKQALVARIKNDPASSLEVQGPMAAPLERRAGRYRMMLLLKTHQRRVLQAVLSEVCQVLESKAVTRHVRWSVDVDPLDLL